MDWLRANWEFLVSLVLGILALIATVWLALPSSPVRRRRRLAYELISNSRLLPSGTIERQKLELRWETRTIAEPSLILLQVRNTGHIPILPEDFKRPITFSFA